MHLTRRFGSWFCVVDQTPFHVALSIGRKQLRETERRTAVISGSGAGVFTGSEASKEMVLTPQTPAVAFIAPHGAAWPQFSGRGMVLLY